MTLQTWSQTASSNASADATINWAEGQDPATVNDSARAMMAAVAKYRDDLSGVKPSNALVTVGGTTTAYTVTSNQTLTALTNGFTLTFNVGSGLTNGAAVTLAVDGLAAKKIQGVAGSDLNGGELVESAIYTVTYHQPSDAWILHGARSNITSFPSGTAMLFMQTAAPTGWTKDTTANLDDTALRLTTGTVTSRTDQSAFATVFGKTATDDHTLSTGELSIHDHNAGSLDVANHNHDNNSDANNGSITVEGGSGSTVANNGGSRNTGSESPTVNGSTANAGSNNAHNHDMDIRVNYHDCIRATKD